MNVSLEARRAALDEAQRALAAAIQANAAIDVPFAVRQDVAKALDAAERALNRAKTAIGR